MSMKVCVAVLTYHKIPNDKLERCIWSIESQENVPSDFDFDVHIVVNSLDENYYPQIEEYFGKEQGYDVVETESDGHCGRGKNSVYDYYKSIRVENEYTHLMLIDGDDYYYPMAFKCVYDLWLKSEFDYLSGTSPFVDSLRTAPPQDGRPTIKAAADLYVWSFLDIRPVPMQGYTYWDGRNILGGEPYLCVSNKVVDADIRYLEGDTITDDYFHLLDAILAHLDGKIRFVNTDCNEIYVYDCSNDTSLTRKDKQFDPELGWPYDLNGLVKKTTQRDRYIRLKQERINRHHVHYSTLPQIWGADEKAKFVAENHIPQKV